MGNYKKFITLLLIFSIHMMPFNLAYASTTLGGWTLAGLVADGASSIVNGTKNVVINGVNVVKTSTAKITPTVGAVSKVLARGAAGYALSVAVQQLLGAVDWVLDPANNQIRYTPKEDLSKPPVFCQNYYETQIANPSVIAFGCSISEVGQNTCKKRLQNTKVYGCTISNVTETSFRMVTSCKVWDGECYGFDSQIVPQRKPNPYYNPQATNEAKTLPLDVVAAQVISNAQSETDQQKKAGAQTATTTAAQDLLDTDSGTRSNVINQLETNARTQTNEQATGEAKPVDPANPAAGDALKLNFPVFCSWAPTICEAAQTVISFPQTLTNWWLTATTSLIESWEWSKSRYEAAATAISEFFKENPTQDNELEFNDPTDVTDTSIQFSNQCPAPITLASFSYHGTQQDWKVDFSGWCDVLSTFFKPIVIAMASLSAILIVSGVRENG
ncbi:hypothetical protein F4T90_00885 [Acinetobacter junii]|uniref:virulence factor TspB C-terminal domain-related protein n=1 Tax=Acinetobacter junii TaxID=40215 RepID=UPI00129867E5|nr:virulence factor TspB C-terminal domain-related protein [Acinetobacter junii]MQZ56011.1 hypothetical protein [Acinetobacter junii]